MSPRSTWLTSRHAGCRCQRFLNRIRVGRLKGQKRGRMIILIASHQHHLHHHLHPRRKPADSQGQEFRRKVAVHIFQNYFYICAASRSSGGAILQKLHWSTLWSSQTRGAYGFLIPRLEASLKQVSLLGSAQSGKAHRCCGKTMIHLPKLGPVLTWGRFFNKE